MENWVHFKHSQLLALFTNPAIEFGFHLVSPALRLSLFYREL